MLSCYGQGWHSGIPTSDRTVLKRSTADLWTAKGMPNTESIVHLSPRNLTSHQHFLRRCVFSLGFLGHLVFGGRTGPQKHTDQTPFHLRRYDWKTRVCEFGGHEKPQKKTPRIRWDANHQNQRGHHYPIPTNNPIHVKKRGLVLLMAEIPNNHRLDVLKPYK